MWFVSEQVMVVLGSFDTLYLSYCACVAHFESLCFTLPFFFSLSLPFLSLSPFSLSLSLPFFFSLPPFLSFLSSSRSTNNPNVANAKRVADLYAEVIGVLSQVRFLSVRMRFFAELRNPQNTLSVIISVIEGLSFVRVKMYPVEELEGWLVFLQVMINNDYIYLLF